MAKRLFVEERTLDGTTETVSATEHTKGVMFVTPMTNTPSLAVRIAGASGDIAIGIPLYPMGSTPFIVMDLKVDPLYIKGTAGQIVHITYFT